VDTKAQLTRHFRKQLPSHLVDDSGIEASGTAIYSLSDPRELRTIRYVGQTNAPRRRFLQHLNTARLWMPDETPWWVHSPKLRPLYSWIRELYRDDRRLPVMLISTWVEIGDRARVPERTRIYECLAQQLPLLNVETEVLQRQMPLL
jgi:hypothetical protein